VAPSRSYPATRQTAVVKIGLMTVHAVHAFNVFVSTGYLIVTPTRKIVPGTLGSITAPFSPPRRLAPFPALPDPVMYATVLTNRVQHFEVFRHLELDLL